MIEIKTKNYITIDDVEELTDRHWTTFEFAQMAENDSYITLACDDDSLADLEEDIEWEMRKQSNRFERLLNQKMLIMLLRDAYNIKDDILIYVAW